MRMMVWLPARHGFGAQHHELAAVYPQASEGTALGLRFPAGKLGSEFLPRSESDGIPSALLLCEAKGSFVLRSLCVSWGRRNRGPQPWWLKTPETSSLRVPEAGTLKSRCQQGGALCGGSGRILRCLFQLPGAPGVPVAAPLNTCLCLETFSSSLVLFSPIRVLVTGFTPARMSQDDLISKSLTKLYRQRPLFRGMTAACVSGFLSRPPVCLLPGLPIKPTPTGLQGLCTGRRLSAESPSCTCKPWPSRTFENGVRAGAY